MTDFKDYADRIVVVGVGGKFDRSSTADGWYEMPGIYNDFYLTKK